MAVCKVLSSAEERVLQENHIQSEAGFGVLYRDENCIRLLCYDTRDTVIIYRGERSWDGRCAHENALQRLQESASGERLQLP